MAAEPNKSLELHYTRNPFLVKRVVSLDKNLYYPLSLTLPKCVHAYSETLRESQGQNARKGKGLTA